ncbi:hypothetical protein QL285_050686 [Trifolium repens]|nr:hypothetical protein QL285_050686 [Trifolium repens]
MSFKVKFHYGGQFVRDCLLYYQGGQEYDKDDNDPDRWSLFEIKGILKEDCHIEGKYRIWWYRNSNDRYISIVDDNDAYEVVKYASEMNTQVEIFVDHSCKGIAASNPTPIPDPIPAPNQSTRQANVDDTTVNDGNDDEGGGEHDSDDSSYYGSDSSEDEAAGIHFDDSEDERALGLDDGFGIELEEQPIPLQICDVGCSKKKRRKTVANRNTPKKSNVSDNNEDLGVDDDIVMEQRYDSEELNSSDPDVSDGEKAPKYDKFRMEELHKDYEFKEGLEFASLEEFKERKHQAITKKVGTVASASVTGTETGVGPSKLVKPKKKGKNMDDTEAALVKPPVEVIVADVSDTIAPIQSTITAPIQAEHVVKKAKTTHPTSFTQPTTKATQPSKPGSSQPQMKKKSPKALKKLDFAKCRWRW